MKVQITVFLFYILNLPDMEEGMQNPVVITKKEFHTIKLQDQHDQSGLPDNHSVVYKNFSIYGIWNT